MSRVLIVEDDDDIAAAVRDHLHREAIDSEQLREIRPVVERLRQGDIDIILLDVMLPDGSGFDLCRDLRHSGLTIPIIMLTARNEDHDQVLGLGLGADDYVTKPFSAATLIARIKAQLRRASHYMPRSAPASEARPSADLARQDSGREGIARQGADSEGSGGQGVAQQDSGGQSAAGLRSARQDSDSRGSERRGAARPGSARQGSDLQGSESAPRYDEHSEQQNRGVTEDLNVTSQSGGRTGSDAPGAVVSLGDRVIDFGASEIRRGEHAVDMTAKERTLLSVLVHNANQVFTRDRLFTIVWGDDHFGDPGTVAVHVRRLREKLEDDPSAPKFLQTVRGLGYRFRPGAQHSVGGVHTSKSAYSP